MKWEFLRSQAINYASLKGYSQESEDFAQYYSICLLDNNTRPIRLIWIDYLRQEFGATRSKVNELRIHPKRLRQITPYNEPLNEMHYERKMIFYKKFLTEREQLIFQYYIEGYGVDAIGKKLGVSGSRIHRIMGRAILRLTQVIGRGFKWQNIK